MLKKILMPIVILSMLCFVQCSDDHPTPGQGMYKAGNGGGGNGGGNGGGGGGNGGGGSGGGDSFGDLIICLRTPDGIPVYLPISGEHGVAYYPLPIMVDALSDEPLKNDDYVPGTPPGIDPETHCYVTFDLNEEGEVIPDPTGEYIVKEVEFGRLNIVRAPQSVLDQALNEAVTSLTQVGVNNITTDASGRLIAIIGAEDWIVNYDESVDNDEFNDKTIDSPRENVALYQELMGNRLNGALSFLTNYGFTDDDVLTLAVGAIAAGADKTGNIIVDEMAYMNDWLIRWTDPDVLELTDSPDQKGRHYYDYSSFNYNRYDAYWDKVVRITELDPAGTWENNYYRLYDVVPWTNPAKRINYHNGASINITGFSDAADDAVQVLEFIHSSDLIVYSPDFKIND